MRIHMAIGLMFAFLTNACAQQEATEPPATPDEGGAISVAVRLQEWSVVPEESSAPAGEIDFDVENVGDNEHEFMVVRTDLGLTDLPTQDDGSFDEEGEGVEILDAMNAEAHGGEEHEVVQPDDEKEFMYELEAGKYVLLCNLVEEETEDAKLVTEVHFKLGMRIPFTVEG